MLSFVLQQRQHTGGTWYGGRHKTKAKTKPQSASDSPRQMYKIPQQYRAGPKQSETEQLKRSPSSPHPLQLPYNTSSFHSISLYCWSMLENTTPFYLTHVAAHSDLLLCSVLCNNFILCPKAHLFSVVHLLSFDLTEWQSVSILC